MKGPPHPITLFPDKHLPMKHLFSIVLALAAAASGMTSCKNQNSTAATTETTDTVAVTTVKFDADSAYASVVAQCQFGPRVPNTEAHAACARYIVERFKALGLSVTEQKADLKTFDGQTWHSTNIIASYKPELRERVILCAHWDSRPWADADADSTKHRTPVMAANDGASGVAVMLEVARLLGQLNPAVGIDFICFDSEDGGAPYWAESQAPDDGSDWCLGSQYGSSHPHTKDYTARYGILLDMVGGQDARFCYEGVSLRYARDVTLRLWDAAQRAGAGQLFLQQEGGYAQDDHVPMNEVAGIPTVDIIPFVEGEHTFGATWHTTHDTPENISRETLRGVGQTLLQLLSEEK